MSWMNVIMQAKARKSASKAEQAVENTATEQETTDILDEVATSDDTEAVLNDA